MRRIRNGAPTTRPSAAILMTSRATRKRGTNDIPDGEDRTGNQRGSPEQRARGEQCRRGEEAMGRAGFLSVRVGSGVPPVGPGLPSGDRVALPGDPGRAGKEAAGIYGRAAGP